MRRLLQTVALLLAFGACHLPASQQQPTEGETTLPVRAQRLIFGVSAYYGDNPETMLQPLVRYLEKEIGIPVKLRVAETYVELPGLLEKDDVDVAQLAPLSYVHLRRKAGLVPVATPIIGGSPTYLGHIYVRTSSPYQTLDDLRGRTMAYVSPESSSGYLFPRELLRNRGHDPNAFFAATKFLGAHPDVQDAVLNGEADAGAAFDMTSDWTGPLERPEGLRVIAKTERIPNDCIAARTGYDPGAVAALRRALVSLRPGQKDAEEILSLLKVNGWVPADDSRYDRIEEVVRKDPMTAAPTGAVLR